MAYDENLAQRVRDVVAEQTGVSEKKMFGGLSFLLHGNMACGIVGDDLMVRVGREAAAEALAKPHARPMDFTGKPLPGYVYVAPEGTGQTRALRSWVSRGMSFAATLPPKKQASKKKAAKKAASKTKAKRSKVKRPPKKA
jgi:TfoX/Sxy family transcriptional regulator of competence genes